MKVVIQRVSQASVKINGTVKSSIDQGILVLLGITQTDGPEEIKWLCHKILNLRIFNDDNGIMNKSVMDVQGDALIVSQFTLMASTKKGHRPSYMKAANAEIAIPLYEKFINEF